MQRVVHFNRVLLVDDDPEVLRLITLWLERHDFTVLAATSGKDALKVLERIVPDLIIMDAMMPGMDGFKTAARIKSNRFVAHVPVVFMSALTQSRHVVRGFQAGGVDYVRKPVDLAELLARARVHLAQARALQASVTSLDATGAQMIMCDVRGTLLWGTPLGEMAIARIFPDWERGSSILPEPLRVRLERLLALPIHVGTSVHVNQEFGSLQLDVLAQLGVDEVLIRLAVHNVEEDVSRLRATLDLTAREAEVLLWLSHGKATRELGGLLGISPRTVQKHLERIFAKVQVESRSAAVALALRLTGE